MKEQVIKIVSQMMNVPISEVKDDSSPDSLAEWDSLKHMGLILALEEEFRVEFSDTEIMSMLSVKEILEVLRKRIK
jgi:acyl carrier protein